MSNYSEALNNKQRIYLGGNHGANNIYEIVRHVLQEIQKPADFYSYGEALKTTSAPIIIMRGADELTNGQAAFNQLSPHILLIHRIKEDVPAGYSSFDDYISQIEILADNLPKAGSLFFFEEDPVGILIGKKEREDVKETPYSKLKNTKTSDGYILESDGSNLSIVTENKDFPEHAAGAKALLQRIGVSENQFFNALKSYK
ncbi:MAG: hypothetical protein JXR10_01320 [Cyclobacteriaceae bacterium]